MNSQSEKDELVGLVQSIIRERIRLYKGRTNVQTSIHAFDWDRMSSPKVFCDPDSVENPSLRLVMFYDVLSRSQPSDRKAFTQMVINNVVDDPHCECASELSHLVIALRVPEADINQLLATGIRPRSFRALKRAESKVGSSWPTSGQYAIA